MSRLPLPEPQASAELIVRDEAAARQWLAGLPMAQPLAVLPALQGQLAALDALSMPPGDKLAVLDTMRSVVLGAAINSEARYAHKPLPLAREEKEAFLAVRRLLRLLAVAYLRTLPQLAPPAAALALHRAAVALRLELWQNLLAGAAWSATPARLLHGLLLAAESLGIERQALIDPVFRAAGESDIASQVAWAFMLMASEPHALTPNQLLVANRAYGRWKALVGFSGTPAGQAHVIPLSALCDADLQRDGGAQVMDVHHVLRKIRRRIEALQAGETPEELKLGRELSGAACIRLLTRLEQALRRCLPPHAEGSGELRLVLGWEHLYALFSNQVLNDRSFKEGSNALAHQRMEIFGFDRLSDLPNSVKKMTVPSESWVWDHDEVTRAGDAGARIAAPCLVGHRANFETAPLLGLLRNMRSTDKDYLWAGVRWFDGHVQPAVYRPAGNGPKTPVFLLLAGEAASIFLPANLRVKPEEVLTLSESLMQHVRLGEVEDRGADFVRYGARLL